MKILIISFSFPPNKDGVSEAASVMADGFVKKGWSVEILTEKSEMPRNNGDDSFVNIHEVVHTVNSGQYVMGYDLSSNYGDFLRRGNWNVIIFHGYSWTLYQALPLLEKISAKKVFVSHGYNGLIWDRMPNFPFGIPSLIRRFLRSFLMFHWLSLFDRVVYLSHTIDFQAFYDHWIATKSGYLGRRVIPNGVCLNTSGKNPGDFRTGHEIPSNAFLMVCVANYSKRKDQAYAVRAFRKAAIPGSVLVFIGSHFNECSDAFQEEDRAYVDAHSPGTVIWLEKQSRASTLDALAACDACVLSANHEAQPIVLLESMRESKPWVARDAGCIASLEGGICVRSEMEMAEAFLRLYADAQLRDRLGREGRKAVESKYHRDAYVEAYVDLLREMTS